LAQEGDCQQRLPAPKKERVGLCFPSRFSLSSAFA
jgi:hypothetical protein